MRLLFDYTQDEYDHMCSLALEYFEAEGAEEKVAIEAEITASTCFNYLTEEAAPRDILYYVCMLDNRLSEEQREVWHQKREAFSKVFN